MKKLKGILISEGISTTTQYWILPNGKVKKMRSGHEEYLSDTGMTYGQAFHDGHIRVAGDDDDGTPSAEWSKDATAAAKKSLGAFIKKSDEGVLFYDLVKPNKKTAAYRQVDYLKSGNTDYRGFLKIR